jgi:hypothetical protein
VAGGISFLIVFLEALYLFNEVSSLDEAPFVQEVHRASIMITSLARCSDIRALSTLMKAGPRLQFRPFFSPFNIQPSVNVAGQDPYKKYQYHLLFRLLS